MNCDRCGRFHNAEPGSAWQLVFTGWLPEPDHMKTRCKPCVEKHGAFEPQAGIRDDDSCGVVDDHPFNPCGWEVL